MQLGYYPIAEHPAVRAWARVSSNKRLPSLVLPVEESGKASIYRLVGIHGDKTSIIAKRSHFSTIEIERTMYEEILPRLPVSSLRYYGSVADSDSELSWLFIEDIGRLLQPKSLLNYQCEITQWLATFHTTSSNIVPPVDFPRKDTTFFLQRLQLTRNQFLERLTHDDLKLRDRLVLENFVRQCDLLAANWAQIEDRCHDLPDCMVHGDVADENIGIDGTATDKRVLLIDWEKAGWGNPAVDLPQASFEVYEAISHKQWPHLSLSHLCMIEQCGRIFSVFSRNLGPKPARKVHHYLRRLQLVSREMKLTKSSFLRQFATPISESEKSLKSNATTAWLDVGATHRMPERVSILHEKAGKSVVCRLIAAGPFGESIIGKHTMFEPARIEALIYERVLAELDIEVPKYYGFLPEPDGKSAWVFIEDAGEIRFQKDDAEHRVLAAYWLAKLHTDAVQLASELNLPQYNAFHYQELLQSARKKIDIGMGNPTFSHWHLEVLQAVLNELAFIASHWNTVEQFCMQVPATLVHGDFVEKNVRMRVYSSKTSLVAFDWESVGFGVPAVDLVNVDAATYSAAVKPVRPIFTETFTQRLVDLGTVFRTLQLISWAGDTLGFDWAERAIRKQLFYYKDWLRNSLEAFLQEG